MTANYVAICPPQPVDSLYERLYFTTKKLGSIYIHVFNENACSINSLVIINIINSADLINKQI